MEKVNPNRPVVLIKEMTKSFGENNVLNGFTMTLNKGEHLVIMGKSGSGKSVMIKCLVGLLNQDGGLVKIMNKDISKLNQQELDVLRSQIGFLFQGSALYDSMTVRENLEFPLRRRITNKVEVDKMVVEALTNVNLLEAIDLMPSELSGGMKRRIALARAIMLKPRLIIYDEPTTGLDPITAKEIIALMKTIQKKYEASAIVITHDVDCARVVADRMILLIDGINYIEGSFQELSNSKDQKVQAFFK